MSKVDIINGIIEVEGGYIDHPSDKGGATMYGITEKVARENGYVGDMRNLPRELAFDIYAKKYWDINKLDAIEALSSRIAEEIADTGVNMGTKVAATFLQRALNVLNLKQGMYSDLVVDGIIGAKSIDALRTFLSRRPEGELVLLRALNSLQGARYIEIAENREANEDFIYGWFLHRIKI